MIYQRIVRRGDDQGVALLSVVSAMMILSLFLLVGLNTVIRNMAVSRKAQDTNLATATAQAGVDDFLQQMNIDLEFAGNLGLNTWSSWRDVQGSGDSSGATEAAYRYMVVSSGGGQIVVKIQGVNQSGSTAAKLNSNGMSSGTPNQVLYATLKSRSFLSYVYLSDIEVVDPTLVGDPSSCATYYYTGRSSNTNCAEIQWAGGDVVQGPLHSNDALQINGAVQFKNNTTTTAWPSALGKNGLTNAQKTWWGTQSAPLPAYPPHYDDPLVLPSSNSELLSYVEPKVDSSSNTTRPGCYYQGATKIIFTGTTMSVLSPGTTRSDTPSRCYNRSTPTTLQTGLAIPQVIYVDAGTATCTTGQIGYPISGESYSTGSASANFWGHSPNYSCKRGSVYVSGTVNTRTTVAANDDVVITANLSAQSTNSASTDVVGLIAGNYVWVYNPVNGSGTNLLNSSSRVSTVQAGILALRHSFLVQNWDDGSTIGTLNVTGAIAQKFRGPVGTSQNGVARTGYLKNYVYDDRLQYLRPPYFIEPVGNTYGVVKTVAGSS